MKIYDESMKEVEEYDPSAFDIEMCEMPVTHRWVVDIPAVTEKRVVREYPSGARECEIVTVEEEVGHWLTLTPNGSAVEWDEPLPEAWKTMEEVQDVMRFGVLVPLSEGERFEREVPNDVLDKLREVIGDQDDAICELFEQIEANDAIIGEQDAAICALYEMMEA